MAIKELKYEDVKQFNVKDRNKWHEFAKTSASEDENHIVKYAAELAYQLEIVREKNGGLNNLFQMLDATERALKQFGEFGISPNDHDKAMCILIQTWEYGTELFMAVSDYPDGFHQLRKAK